MEGYSFKDFLKEENREVLISSIFLYSMLIVSFAFLVYYAVDVFRM